MAVHCWRTVGPRRAVPRHDAIPFHSPAAALQAGVKRLRSAFFQSGLQQYCRRRTLCIEEALSLRGEGLPDENSLHIAKGANSNDKPGVQPARRRNSSRNLSSTEAQASRGTIDMETLPLIPRAPAQSYSAREAVLRTTTGGANSSSSSSGSGSGAGQQGQPTPPGFSWEYLVLLCTLGVVICYADRSNISTAVLPMAQQFGWDKAYQGLVLSVFFGGYATTQILGGKLADQLGGKMVLAAGVALWSLFTFATPAAAAAGSLPLMTARVMLGVGEGVAFPSIHSLISRNVPARSQTTAVGIVTAASYAGTALAFGVSPYLISRFGWEWVFYGFASLALLWLPLWLPVVTLDRFRASGQQQSTIATGEEHLAPSDGSDGSSSLTAASCGDAGQLGAASSSSSSPPLTSSSVNTTTTTTTTAMTATRTTPPAVAITATAPVDMWALLRRREVRAICIAQYAQSWGMYGLLNWLPTFFSEYYNIQLADLGSYTLLPYVFQGGLGAATGFMADRLLRSGWRVGTVRRMLQVAGMLGPAACLCLAVSPLVGSSAQLASGLITAGLGLSALTLGGVSASHLDVAPRNAGLVFGAGNTAATLAGLVSVPVTGFLLQTTGSWPLVFGITALHYVVGAAVWAAWCGEAPLPEDGG
ncbi:hypothetical protein Agub_g10743, partial [Astrephomene gubernaculifera]